MPFTNPVKLILQVLLGAFIVFSVSEILKLSSYLYLKEIITIKMRMHFHRKNQDLT